MSDDQPDFWKEGDDDEPKYVDKFRNCGKCGNEFWSNAAELESRGFRFIPMFCETCAASAAADLRRRTAIFREKIRSGELRWKKRPLTGTKPWEKAPPPEPAGSASAADLLAGVADDLLKPRKKRG